MKIKNLSILLLALTILIPANYDAPVNDSEPVYNIETDFGLVRYNHDIAKIIYDKILGERFLSPTLFRDNHIVAYYGHPQSKIMGIVGRHPVDELGELLKEAAASYDRVNGDKGVVPAIYLIYGTCQPGGEINRINPKLLDKYIEYTITNGMLLYLDHQIGKYKIEEAMSELLPYLKYPNVHLAFDPEWHTTRPMREVGHVTGVEVNSAQKLMKDYMLKNGIPGKRQLVFHQFNPKMLQNREQVTATFDPVILVHTTSGWGPPDNKISTHDRNALTVNIPNKGFKLWYYYSSRKGVHFDNPIMTPEQVLSLRPEPGLIIYQ